jgi:hypothetical protein
MTRGSPVCRGSKLALRPPRKFSDNLAQSAAIPVGTSSTDTTKYRIWLPRGSSLAQGFVATLGSAGRRLVRGLGAERIMMPVKPRLEVLKI